MRTCRPLKRGVSIGKAAALLKVHVCTLRYWMDHGKVPGVRVTGGGHRWLPRSAFAAFARSRGVKLLEKERRRHPRTLLGPVPVLLLVRKGRLVLARGEGVLKDASLGGFRAQEVRWQDGLAPALGRRIEFRILGKILSGTQGAAEVAWHQDNRRERGATLGAALERWESADARRAWESYLSDRMN